VTLGVLGSWWWTQQNPFLVPWLVDQAGLLLSSLYGCTALSFAHAHGTHSTSEGVVKRDEEAQGNPKDWLVWGVVLVSFVTSWNKHMSRKGCCSEMVEKTGWVSV